MNFTFCSMQPKKSPGSVTQSETSGEKSETAKSAFQSSSPTSPRLVIDTIAPGYARVTHTLCLQVQSSRPPFLQNAAITLVQINSRCLTCLLQLSKD